MEIKPKPDQREQNKQGTWRIEQGWNTENRTRLEPGEENTFGTQRTKQPGTWRTDVSGTWRTDQSGKCRTEQRRTQGTRRTE